MKKALSVAALFLAVVLSVTVAFAAGADASDPLVSLSYLQGLFSQSVGTAVDSKLAASDDAVRSDLQKSLSDLTSSVEAAAGQNYAPSAIEAAMKEGDSIAGPTGLTVIPLAGSIAVTVSYGTVVDATDGTEVASGSTLIPNHRYIVAESSLAHFAAASPTAILSYQGHYGISLSRDVPDYFSIARALQTLGLFRGTGNGIGGGFDLHLTPTRAEGLVMFIRILGEEADALACTYTHPFTDVPDWADRYVAWAYSRGYSNGVGGNLFGSDLPISAVEYEEFILRALGYSVAGIHDYATSLERAYDHGAITAGEYDQLKNQPFLRAHVAYLSYYTLDMVLSGSQFTLAQHLTTAGVFNPYQLAQARYHVSSSRLI